MHLAANLFLAQWRLASRIRGLDRCARCQDTKPPHCCDIAGRITSNLMLPDRSWSAQWAMLHHCRCRCASAIIRVSHQSPGWQAVCSGLRAATLFTHLRCTPPVVCKQICSCGRPRAATCWHLMTNAYVRLVLLLTCKTLHACTLSQTRSARHPVC